MEDEYSDRSKKTIAFRWDDVREVIAFKKDCYVHDQIRMVFVTDEILYEVTESMPGWNALIEALPRCLPGAPAPSEWWARVAQPPFAPCVTKIYSACGTLPSTKAPASPTPNT